MNKPTDTSVERAQKAWNASPAGTVHSLDQQKGTKEFFATVLHKRFNEEHYWLEKEVDFKRFTHKKVLEVGCGAGFDAYMFCKYGADYTGIDIASDNPEIVKKHLSYYGYKPKVYHMNVLTMPFKEKFDAVYSFGVLHHVQNFDGALQKIHQALKPDGELDLIVYHKNSIFYWYTIVFYKYILKFGWRRFSLQEILSQIEYTTSAVRPYVTVYSIKELRKRLERSGFCKRSVIVRQFRLADLPCIPCIFFLYRLIPERLLRLLGKKWGWYLYVRAKKI